MTRQFSRMATAGVLMGLCLIGVGCGGSKQEETSNAPVGKPPPGSSAPVPSSGPIGSEGVTKMSDQGIAVQRK